MFHVEGTRLIYVKFRSMKAAKEVLARQKNYELHTTPVAFRRSMGFAASHPRSCIH